MTLNDVIGVPWKKGGRDLSGLDCWGLVVQFFPDMIDYDQAPDGVLSVSKEFLRRIEENENDPRFLRLEEPEDDCLVLMGRIDKIHHCGVYKSGFIVHANKMGVVADRIPDLRFQGWKRFDFYRWNNV